MLLTRSEDLSERARKLLAWADLDPWPDGWNEPSSDFSTERGLFWADEAVLWVALGECDPDGVLAMMAGLDGGPVSHAAIARRLGISKRGASIRADTYLRRLRSYLSPMSEDSIGIDPAVFDFGPNTSQVVSTLKRAAGLGNFELVALAENPPDGRLVAEALTLSRQLTPIYERLRIVMRACVEPWAPESVAESVWIAAIDAALGPGAPQRGRVYVSSIWDPVVKPRKAVERWIPPYGWEPVLGHPVPPPPHDVDCGPNRERLTEFYERSARLTLKEVCALDAEWARSGPRGLSISVTVELGPSTDDENPGCVDQRDAAEDWRKSYDVVATIGRAKRPVAYRFGRALGSTSLPESARSPIKDAGGALAVADLIPSEDFDVMTAGWQAALHVASRLEEFENRQRRFPREGQGAATRSRV